MKILLNYNYTAAVKNDLLGYVGENNSRTITLEGLETDGADLYKLILSYPDGVQYEVDITGGEYTVPASLLRAPGSVSMQVLAVRSSDGAYIKKSNIFSGRIEPSVSGNTEPIPPYEDAADALDRVLSAVETAESNAAKSESCAVSANAAKTAAETAGNAAESAAANALESYEGAKQAAQNAAQSAQASTDSEQAVLSAKSEIDGAAETISATAQEVSQNAATVLQLTAIAENAKDTAVEKAQEIADNATQIQRNAADIAELKSDVGLVQDILGGVVIENWAEVQKIVRAGQAAKYFSVGDQFVCEKTKPDGTVEKLVWDVIGIDKDIPADDNYTHSLTLQLHDCFIALQYDAPEALFAFPDGLTAGTYHFSIDSTYDSTYNDFEAYQFTLTTDIPAGGQIMFPWVYQKVASLTKVSSYASNASTTAIESVAVTNGGGGANLGAVTIADDPENNINSIQRARYGSNNWRESAARQYLNSDKAAGSVWTPQTKFDRPPSWVSNTAGFMYGFDKDFISSLGKVKKTTVLNNITDGGVGENSKELIFLLSLDEVGVYDYYKNATIAERIKTLNGSARGWWLRTPAAGSASSVHSTNTSGALIVSSAYSTLGHAPACCIV